MKRYDPLKIEQKWQKIWADTGAFKATEDPDAHKMFIAEMFPYPSGAGLHVGHVRNFTIVDVVARFYHQKGCNVMRPFGYDTFGLPAENYAIKTGISPRQATSENVAMFRKQAQKLGYAVDWSREISTSDPEYYRWTQWCFLQLYKKGLAYQKESYQWWCPVDKTVLANEQVENGCCWRCGHEVEKKKMKQWYFKITDYADELLDGIDDLDWPDKIKAMQKNWIGRSEGAEIEFEVVGANFDSSVTRGEAEDTVSGGPEQRRGLARDTRDDGLSRRDPETVPSASPVALRLYSSSKSAPTTHSIRVFTTRPDTLFGVTFLVLAPEHPLAVKLATPDVKKQVEEYCQAAIKKSEIERQENKEKTGVFTGSYAINPANGEKVPIWIADYALADYGEGALMAVPAHDQRDHDFAEKFDLPIKQVIEKPADSTDDDSCYHGEGMLVNSGKFDGVHSEDAREQISTWLEEQKIGHAKTTYRMRDWLISRQRYWGCPIPIAYDKDGNPHPIPEDQLPVMLPEINDYQPDESGRSALAKAKDWLKVTIDGEEMTRETDTLDGYACSSWYLWRYASPHDDQHAWDPEAVKYWSPVDVYCGADHAVAHLLYVRFWCKFFADQGLLPFREPIKKLMYNGYINAPDGKKMSKSKGNVIDPLDVIDQGYGADTLRTYEMFIGPYDQDAIWNTKAIGGVYRFLNRCWTLCFDEESQSASSGRSSRPSSRGSSLRPRSDCGCPSEATLRTSLNIRHQTIKKVTTDIHRCNFNTAVAALMEYVNHLYKNTPEREDIITLAKLLGPFAPHLSAEMLEHLGEDDSWPEWDEKYLIADTVEVVVQVNGKLRAKLFVAADDLKDTDKLQKLALEQPNIKKYTDGKTPKKIIIPPHAKLINIVI